MAVYSRTKMVNLTFLEDSFEQEEMNRYFDGWELRAKGSHRTTLVDDLPAAIPLFNNMLAEGLTPELYGLWYY